MTRLPSSLSSMKPVHTLLATVGRSPQVVTETLYAIHAENGQWPDEIVIITTTVGKADAVQGLLHDRQLERLCRQLQRPMPTFSEEHVLVVPGANGTQVEDARSREDHEALANFIMTVVRNRTSVPDGSLHASLAGGRKTMTFYIGYAMSLFGRAQDRLSHVLVSEGYENNPKFWFPTDDPQHRDLQTREGPNLDASLASVTLAPIPFVRHRHDLPQVLLQKGEQQGEAVNFAELVQLINLGECPQTVHLEVDLPGRCIRVRDTASTVCVTLEPSPIDLAFYAMLARATVQHESDYLRPSKDRPDLGMAKILVEELLALCGKRAAETFERSLSVLEDADGIKASTISALEKGVTQTWFDQRRNSLGALLEQKLPASLARWVAPGIVWSEDGVRLNLHGSDKTPKGGGYGIALQPQQIQVLGMA